MALAIRRPRGSAPVLVLMAVGGLVLGLGGGRLWDRELSLSRGFLLTMFLLAIGMVGTFPPVYQFFARV